MLRRHIGLQDDACHIGVTSAPKPQRDADKSHGRMYAGRILPRCRFESVLGPNLFIGLELDQSLPTLRKPYCSQPEWTQVRVLASLLLRLVISASNPRLRMTDWKLRLYPPTVLTSSNTISRALQIPPFNKKSYSTFAGTSL